MNEYLSHISINSDIRFGKPCIKGTRIAVVDILMWLASGMTYEEIYDEYPAIKKEHILAALYFAAHKEEVTKIISAKYEVVN
jgi:uncharacterized protein (DUF433 family)